MIRPVIMKNWGALLAVGALLSGCVSPFAQFTLPGQTMVARPATSVSQLPQQSAVIANLPSQVTVQPGDTLWKISRRLDVPLRDLIDANGLMPPYAIRGGQVLRIPAGRYYTVQRGDTVTNVAARFGIASSDLARLNDLPAPYVILIGQQLRLPATSDVPQRQVAEDSLPLAPVRVAGITPPPASPARSVTQEELPPMAPVSPAPAAASTPARITPVPAIPADSAAGADAEPMATASVDDVAAPPMPSSRPASAAAEPVSAPVATTVAPPVEAMPPAPQKVVAPAPPAQKIDPSVKLALMWPVDGRVIATFGPKDGGLRNDGINIAAPRGAAIRAAESGVVVYAGNGLQAFGNLVLIRHANGWVTAYAHADKLLVERGSKVARGQTIATVGSSGDVDKPQVHFQVRTSDGAVDPQKYLS